MTVLGLVGYGVPLRLPPLRIGLARRWRHDADPAHARLRRTVREPLARWPDDGPRQPPG
ncbi:hypothetical protein ACIRPX_24590 [Streptomyces sp. NPDC101225]|uniref:hypothetical protein n=1 Tax=Streptomyces sp. NPDC101225 TaxID=3366135 RepID=UPI00381BB97E